MIVMVIIIVMVTGLEKIENTEMFGFVTLLTSNFIILNFSIIFSILHLKILITYVKHTVLYSHMFCFTLVS